MKLLLSLVALTASFSAIAAPSAADSFLKNYVKTIAQFNVGEETRTDVAQARLAYLNASLNAGTMEKIQFCYEGNEVVTQLVEGTQEEARVGGRTQAEVLAALQAQADLTKLCANQN